ncbi:hypothetical protein ACFL06_00050 [Patescibacteria group bacterium]
MPKIKLNIQGKKIRETAKKTLHKLGERALLTFLGLSFLGVCFAGLLFYFCSNSVKNFKPGDLEDPIQLKEELLGKILKERTEREIKFQQADAKKYTDVFWKEIPSEEE